MATSRKMTYWQEKSASHYLTATLKRGVKVWGFGSNPSLPPERRRAAIFAAGQRVGPLHLASTLCSSILHCTAAWSRTGSWVFWVNHFPYVSRHLPEKQFLVVWRSPANPVSKLCVDPSASTSTKPHFWELTLFSLQFLPTPPRTRARSLIATFTTTTIL